MKIDKLSEETDWRFFDTVERKANKKTFSLQKFWVKQTKK
jgi:hypothetical protein